MRKVFCCKAQGFYFFSQFNLCRDVAFFLGNLHLALEDAQLLTGFIYSFGFVFGLFTRLINLVVLFTKRNLLVQIFCCFGFFTQNIKLVAQNTGLLCVIDKLFFLGRRYVFCLHRLKAGDCLLNAGGFTHSLQLKRDSFLLVVFCLLVFYLLA